MSDYEYLFSDSSQFQGKRLHLGITGSIAAYRACDLLRLLKKLGIAVSVTVSRGARQFVTPLLFEALGATPVYADADSHDGAPFAHLEPGEIADALLIAPASANTLARLAHGEASDLLSTQALAFPGPVLIAPAMNPKMWQHPAVQDNVRLLRERGCEILVPGVGSCACGDTGQGRLCELPELFWAVLKALAPQDSTGQRVLVTLGPTREFWDGVRFWSNPSSGRMGADLALAFWLRGAEVDVICGPAVAFALPAQIHRQNVTSAHEMLVAARPLWSAMQMGIFTAAVADFAPDTQLVPQKRKKTLYPEHFELPFHKNADILMELAKDKGPTKKILAFAAETAADMDELLLLAQEKRARKGADLLAANRVNDKGSGFVSKTNTMAVVDRYGRCEQWPTLTKADVAWRLCSWLLQIPTC
ncbi:MAG: bifunctional phosphopantothenoylcysteine decarboxylase/phosphopantothenate--cysteine ligase CoaBC [Desulfovibrio sp.]|nr:bifunctional phosphopantothenoylcysteine decarboxylase/phosphopantothenate--cysteine ligase CoaBC [Desulfovibrio sp.]